MSGFNSQKLMKYIRLAALGAPVISGVAKYGASKAAAVEAIKLYTGVNVATGGFDARFLAQGWTPYLASVLATYGIPKLAGIIRSL